MVIDSKTTDSNAADNVDSALVCEAWLPACSKEWNRCSTDMSDQQLESKLWERPQFPHNRVPLGGWEFDGRVPCGPFRVFLIVDQVNGFLRVINATARHGR